MAESGLVFQDINKLDEVSKASDSDVLVLTDKQSNNATIIAYINFVSTLLDELDSKSYTLDTGKQTLINAINSLNTRINNITASAEADNVSQAEIVDARIAEPTLVADRLVEASYSILGEAIRAQINALYNEIKNIVTEYIEDGAVTTAKIAPRAVTGALLALSSVAFEHLNSTLQNRITTIESKATASEAKNAEQDTQIGELESNLQEEVGAINETLALKADQDGDYDDLTAGGAKQLLSTVYVDDQVPYNFRTAGGSADIGDRMYEEVVGGTVVWNQLVRNGDFATKTIWSQTGLNWAVASNVATLTVYGTPSTIQFFQYVPTVVGHKYFVSADVNPSKTGRLALRFGSVYTQFSHAENTWTNEAYIRQATSASSEFNAYINANDYVADDTFQVRNCICVDLTAMFGSTIADYIYTLEQGTAGAGVAWFRNMFPKPYYEYNAGELMSVKAGSHDTVGFNAWDEEWELGLYQSSGKATSNNYMRCKNLIPVIEGQTYRIEKPCRDAYTWGYADKNYSNGVSISKKSNGNIEIPTGVHYLGFSVSVSQYGSSTYKNDMCVHLVWDGERNGEYEPYEKHTYPLANIELRGIPKLDANNQLYYDGDTYASDGTVTRKYGIVDMGTLNWSIDVQSSYTRFLASLAPVTGMPVRAVNTVCSKYISLYNNETFDTTWDKVLYAGGGLVMVHDSAYSDVATFKSAMNGVYLLYELAEPTTETADTFANPQVVDDFGTEEYVDYAEQAGDRDVAVPVGHDSQYMNNLRAKLEMAPDSPDGDGDYIVRQSNGENAYIPYTADGRLDAVEETLDLKADANGDYDSLTAGGAKQLLSTVYVDDNEPYNFRTAGGSADIGDRMYEEVVGGSIVWNQLRQNGNFANGTTGFGAYSGSSASVADNVCTITVDATPVREYSVALRETSNRSYTAGHKFFITYTVKVPKSGEFSFDNNRLFVGSHIKTATTANVWQTKQHIMEATGEAQTCYFFPQGVTDGYAVGDTWQIKNIMAIDLTKMFGSTIADYIYSLEQGTAGAGVAWFRNLFPKPYYEYNAGELMSVKAGSHDTVGFNAWDATKDNIGKTTDASGELVNNVNFCTSDYIRIVPNTQYYLKNVAPSGDARTIWFYDFNKEPISFSIISGSGGTSVSGSVTSPANAHYARVVRLATATDFCLHLAWDGERNGEYEPYEKHEYPLAELELRGIPKLDANNQLYYDGDTYASDGSVTRKYAVRVFNGSEGWNFFGSGETINQYFVNDSTAASSALENGGVCTVCDKFKSVSISSRVGSTAEFGTCYTGDGSICFNIDPTKYADVDAWKSYLASNPVTVVYKLKNPTTETADAFTSPQIIDDFGTEEYVDYAYEAGDRDVAIPVGHNSQYMNNLRAKLEMAPESPSGDGKYIVQQMNGENAYIPYTADGRLDAVEAKLPAPPSANGTYKLTATVTANGVSYAWVAG